MARLIGIKVTRPCNASEINVIQTEFCDTSGLKVARFGQAQVNTKYSKHN